MTIVHEWTGPRWPLIGSAAAEWVIGPVFIHGIASRTLAGIRRAVESGRHERAAAGGDHGHRGDHAHRAGRGRAVGRAPATDVGGPLHHAVRSDRVQVAHRGRGPGLRRRRTTSRSAEPGGSTATPSSPLPPPAWRWPTPALDLAREDPDRVGAMMGTALGGVAHGEQNYHALPHRGAHARWIPRSRSPCSPAPRAATSRSSSAAPAPTPPTG